MTIPGAYYFREGLNIIPFFISITKNLVNLESAHFELYSLRTIMITVRDLWCLTRKKNKKGTMEIEILNNSLQSDVIWKVTVMSTGRYQLAYLEIQISYPIQYFLWFYNLRKNREIWNIVNCPIWKWFLNHLKSAKMWGILGVFYLFTYLTEIRLWNDSYMNTNTILKNFVLDEIRIYLPRKLS